MIQYKSRTPILMPISLSDVLWTGDDFAKAIGGKGPTHWHATGVSIDTRTLQPGDVFFALRGPHFDGATFIDAAWNLGACAVVVHDDGAVSSDPAHPTLAVPNTFQALNQLATAARKRFTGPLLALTGSVGKTSVKDGLSHVLSLQGLTSASRNSLNNHLGVPLSLARLPKKARFGIFEIGMNHSGEITELVDLIRPGVTLITQVSYQHGAFFSCLDDIVSAKTEIFSAPGPLVGIIPRDSPHYETFVRNGERHGHMTQWITFGQHPESTIRLISKQPGPFERTRIRISIQDSIMTYDWSLRGDHTIYNSLAIVAGALALGADMSRVMETMQSIQLSSGRGNTRTIGGISIIDDAYNAAPASMLAALRTFSTHVSTPNEQNRPLDHSGKRYILLGQMRELGGQSHACHQALVPLIHACKADGVWLCGSEFKPFLKDIPNLLGYGDFVHDLIPDMVSTLHPGDTILIKGANSMKLCTLISALETAWGKA